MKYRALISALILLSCIFSVANAQDYAGKAIYHPEELKEMDFSDPESKWSFSRMACTENIVLFWDKGFGANITTAPDLEGQNMKVDLANLLEKLEQFYRFFSSDLGWVKPGSKAEKYRMMVMLNYSLEGTAYGGSYDDAIGALWITPNRVQDRALNCVAHELGHAFQSQIWCDGEGVSWGGCGFFEMASQWMLWQVNPDWQTDEYYHLDAFRKLTHKAFLHIDNIYHSPYVLEYWSEKHGPKFIAQLFRDGTADEDPAMTYMRITGTSQSDFCDEMYEAASRMINWDYPRVWDNTRKMACEGWGTKLVTSGSHYMPAPECCPENYGFNVIQLQVPAPNTPVTIDFRGEPRAKGYYTKNTDAAGWRYGIVAVDSVGHAHYTPMMASQRGKVKYTTPEHNIKALYFVVMGAPSRHWRNVDGEENPGDAQWPYSFTVRGTSPVQ